MQVFFQQNSYFTASLFIIFIVHNPNRSKVWFFFVFFFPSLFFPPFSYISVVLTVSVLKMSVNFNLMQKLAYKASLQSLASFVQPALKTFNLNREAGISTNLADFSWVTDHLISCSFQHKAAQFSCRSGQKKFYNRQLQTIAFNLLQIFSIIRKDFCQKVQKC